MVNAERFTNKLMKITAFLNDFDFQIVFAFRTPIVTHLIRFITFDTRQ